MAQKKVGFSNTSYIQGDKLIINNGTTASINFTFEGATDLTFSLPQADGSAGYALITDGSGNLSFGTVSNQGNVQSPGGGGTSPYLTYWTGSYSLGDTGAQYSPGQILFPGGSAPAPGMSFILDPDTGVYRVADNQVGFAGGGSLLGKFSSSGVTTGAVTYTNVGGLVGQALTTDGSGNTSWSYFYGATGATGPQGIQGPTGATGADSTVAGPTGPAGANGANGANGATGATGSLDNVLYFSAQSGTFSGGDMVSGPPLYYDVLFSGSITGDYIVTIESDSPRDWTVTNKTSTGFRADSNSNTAMSDVVYWHAQELISGDIAVVVGATGPQGAQGIQGDTGATGATGATGSNGTGLGISTPLTLSDTATISWTYSLGFNAAVTITANRSISITGATAGDYGTLKIIQGGAGGFRINFGANDKFPSATHSHTTAAGRWDIYGFYYDGTYYNWSYNTNYY